MDDILLKNGRLLEDEFFSKKDAILIEQLRQLQRMEQTQKALSEVSGITNKAVLKHLVDLDIHPDLLATLALVPLVEVAWADGEIQTDERKAILEGSVKLGMGPGSVDHTLLKEWLKQKPSPKMLDAWIAYVRGLCEVLTPPERNALRDTFLTRARHVAEAAGGFLGLTSKISSEEEAMLKKLASAFAD
ncbi:MAG: hypothetical protein WCG36_05785 [bacterium]